MVASARNRPRGRPDPHLVVPYVVMHCRWTFSDMQAGTPNTGGSTRRRVSIPVFVWVAIGVIALVGLIAGLARGVAPPATQLTHNDRQVAVLLLQDARQAARQAEQSAKAVPQLIAANFGLARIECARLLVRAEDTLQRITNTNVAELYMMLRAQQRAALDSLAAQAPDAGSH